MIRFWREMCIFGESLVVVEEGRWRCRESFVALDRLEGILCWSKQAEEQRVVPLVQLKKALSP